MELAGGCGLSGESGGAGGGDFQPLGEQRTPFAALTVGAAETRQRENRAGDLRMRRRLHTAPDSQSFAQIPLFGTPVADAGGGAGKVLETLGDLPVISSPEPGSQFECARESGPRFERPAERELCLANAAHRPGGVGVAGTAFASRGGDAPWDDEYDLYDIGTVNVLRGSLFADGFESANSQYWSSLAAVIPGVRAARPARPAGPVRAELRPSKLPG